jgi:Fic family protein
MDATIRTGVAAKKARLDALRPLPAAVLQRLDEWYDVELAFTSNAIEGNTLTRQETAIVLEKGITVRGKPLRDHMEALDHREAWHYVRDLATGSEPVREHDLRSIHSLVVARSRKDIAGRYAGTARLIAGSSVVFPPASEIPARMAEFAGWLAQAPTDAATAFAAHLRLVSIHPFEDGNGRTARLLMNLLLLRAGYPPVLIGPEERPDYLDALEAAQLDRGGEGYEDFMWRRLDAALTTYLRLAGDPSK